jgi:hypothetical protein
MHFEMGTKKNTREFYSRVFLFSKIDLRFGGRRFGTRRSCGGGKS